MKILFAMIIACLCSGQTITIVNSGSTNAPGFEIAVEKSGKAEYTSQPRRGRAQNVEKMIPESLAQQLYVDAKAAQPLDTLPAPHCAKSASFGTRTYVHFDRQESPDLSCGDGGNAKLRALIGDVNQVTQLFH